jgi:hypothetical protein
MQLLSVDLEELDRCRKVIQDQAEEFGGMSGGLAARDVAPSSFGALPAAIRLAQASQDLHAAAGAQLSAAHNFLGSVGIGLYNEGQRTSQTESSNVNALKAL